MAFSQGIPQSYVKRPLASTYGICKIHVQVCEGVQQKFKNEGKLGPQQPMLAARSYWGLLGISIRLTEAF